MPLQSESHKRTYDRARSTNHHEHRGGCFPRTVLARALSLPVVPTPYNAIETNVRLKLTPPLKLSKEAPTSTWLVPRVYSIYAPSPTFQLKHVIARTSTCSSVGHGRESSLSSRLKEKANSQCRNCVTRCSVPETT